MQAVEEIQKIMDAFPDDLLWNSPAGVASVGFHLQHLAGVLDRLSTYALNKPLSEEQLAFLKNEGKEVPVTSQQLVRQLEQKVNEVLQQLQTIDEAELTDYRPVGRKALPSTVMGLLFHGAEHTMRHTGQLLVTAKIVRAGMA
jgi:uncharacterized damage-inducible protein DinB